MSAIILALVSALVAQPAAPAPKTWKGKTVVLLQPLYTFVIDDAERLPAVRVSEAHGVYYQNGRYRDTDVNRLAQIMRAQYDPMQLQVFDAGTTLIVCKVQENEIERSYVLSFALPLNPKAAVTYLTVVQRTGTFSTADASPDALIRVVLKEGPVTAPQKAP